MVGSEVGQYRVLELLGVGGMGEVYRGVHSQLGRVVALKVMSATADMQVSSQRFQNEARIHAAIRHPNIAALFEHVECNGRSCLVMEYVDGDTLSALLSTRGPLQLTQALQYISELAKALGYLHERSIVHRDIKASNIKIDSQGQAKLLDFGIARAETSPRLTQAGNVIGTLEYMAPEQLCGEPASPQSDLWALGVVLYEMLTGNMPFAATDLSTLHRKITHVEYSKASASNPAVPREIDAIIKRCLQKSPAARYGGADDMAKDIDRFLTAAQQVVSPRQVAVPESIASPGQVASAGESSVAASARSNLPFMTAAAALLLLSVGAALFFILSAGPTQLGNSSGAGADSGVVAQAVLTDASDKTKSTLEPKSAASSSTGDVRSVEVDVAAGQAEVYRNGELIGKTPQVLKEPVGTVVTLTLKRPGYEDYNASFTVTERKRYYSFMMERD